MSPAADPAAWKRLGDLLTRRRVELDPRYQNRSTFSAERGLDYRLAYDIEEARRKNFRTTTLTAIAAAYAVTADSLFAVLRDGTARLEPAPGSAAEPPSLRPVPDPPRAADPDFPEDDNDAIGLLIADDPALMALWRLRDADGKPYPREERIRLMRAHLEGMRARARRAERETGT